MCVWKYICGQVSYYFQEFYFFLNKLDRRQFQNSGNKIKLGNLPYLYLNTTCLDSWDSWEIFRSCLIDKLEELCAIDRNFNSSHFLISLTTTTKNWQFNLRYNIAWPPMQSRFPCNISNLQQQKNIIHFNYFNYGNLLLVISFYNYDLNRS